MESVAGEKAAAGRYVAIDCEMVETGERLPDGSFRKKKSELARVSLVNYFGAVLLDVFVKPQRPITDYRTEVSGIRPKDLKNAMPFLEAQQKVLDIVQDRIMVGHAIIHDLSALRIKHPRYLIRDTSKYKPFFEYNNGRTPGLKTLVDCVLDMEIQSGEHSSVEDARFTMLLYRHAKEEWEKAVGAQYGLKMKQFFEKARQREEKERRRLENKANIERKKVKQQLKEAKQQQKKRKADDDSSSSSSNSSSEDESSEEEADESDDDQDDSE
ncbi:ribonuclease H-like domain-containing protein [Syncephalastrum racemosum]|uniref:RNA exonuclease 4 n=1 Tax=Syncephalastrum racemosum TaxID=13706 RepID=A0A1X2H144_SYNRA|nr:ribonuclease H-like domain-containing protein [Syncephalastrum racemosum]